MTVDIQLVTDIMFPDFPSDRRADVGVVLGNGIMTLPVLIKGLEMLKTGQVRHLILTGGAVVSSFSETPVHAHVLDYLGLPQPKAGEKESDYMLRYISGQSVQKTEYTVEDEAQNTAQNFANINGLIAYSSAESIALLSVLPTRALMTMRKQEEMDSIAAKTAFTVNVFPLTFITPQNWYLRADSRQFVLEEYWKIDHQNPSNYFNRGFCVPINLQQEISRASKLNRLRCNGTSMRQEFV